jgi:hypothetical protein
MPYGPFKKLARLIFIYAIPSGTLCYASCSVDEVIVNGQVENAPLKGTVRVQLVYSNQKVGDSAELTLDSGSFRIEIPFLTQSRAPVLLGSLREKCDRKPEKVVVTLVEGDREDDRVSLDLAKDFKKTSSTAYTVRSEILLRGPSS